jgi:hypothetical protein
VNSLLTVLSKIAHELEHAVPAGKSAINLE